MGLLIAVLAVLALFVIVFIGAYNRLVSMRQEVRESWSAIETELRRRFDLIPNLVETVKGYAGHERETLDAVIKARNAANFSGPIEAQVNSQNALTQALGRLIALSEAYPQLKANENFNQLQRELSDTESRISSARRFYNANVKELNTACESFPTLLIARGFGFHPQPYFGIEDHRAFEPVSVNFGSGEATIPQADSEWSTIKLSEREKQE